MTITDRIRDARMYLTLAIDALDAAAKLARNDAMDAKGPGIVACESTAWLAAKTAQVAAAKAREALELVL